MTRHRLLMPFGVAALLLQSGCAVDVNAAASSALQGVLNALVANVIAGVVNGLIPA